MLEDSKNKMMDGGASSNKADEPTTIRAVSVQKNEYFFPGGGIWKPMTVIATTLGQAEAIYKEKRQPVSPEEKVEEEAKETNNE
jgi:hypothetical protein